MLDLLRIPLGADFTLLREEVGLEGLFAVPLRADDYDLMIQRPI